MRSKKFEAYVERVVAILADEFGWDQTTRDICRRHLHEGNPFGPGAELICDEPTRANWRLKSNRERPMGLRMAYYGWAENGRERERRITEGLTKALDESL